MDVHRRLDDGSQVELLGSLRIGRPRALGREDLLPALELAPARDLLLARPDHPGAQRLGHLPVAREHRLQHLHQHVRGVQRRASEQPRVQIALPGPDADVEVADAARRNAEGGLAGSGHVPVEDDAGVAAALVRLEEVDDRVAAGLLLPVAREPNVDGQRAFRGEQRSGLQLQIELALVVGHAPGIDPPVANGRLERRALPEVERRLRLHVEVPVGDDRRRPIGVLRRPNLSDHERVFLGLHDFRLATCRADEVAHPLGSAHDLARPRGIGADARDAEELEELLHPFLRRLGHGGGVYSAMLGAEQMGVRAAIGRRCAQNAISVVTVRR